MHAFSRVASSEVAWWYLRGIILCIALGITSASLAQSPPTDPAAGAPQAALPPSTVWKIVGGDCDYQIPIHRRAIDPDNGQPLEQVKLLAGNGTHIHVATAVSNAPVIDELEIELPLRADQNDLQLLARVVLPRSIDPNTNGPITVLVGGDLYQGLGNWQMLRLTHLPQRVERRVRVLRHSMNVPIDVREAFVDLIVVNAYGGPGATEVWLGNPVLDGKSETPALPPQQVSARPIGNPAAARISAHANSSVKNGIQATQFMNDELGNGVAVLEPAQTISLTGDLLSVGDRPIYVRAIDWQGEDFAFLSQLGFNTLRMSETASLDQLLEASRLGLWIVCPPPDLSVEVSINMDYSRILAWDLGSDLDSPDLTKTALRATAVRKKQDLPKRPIVGAPNNQLMAYSRHLDILLHSREPLGTSISLSSFANWLGQRPQLCRPGVPHWATVQTEVIPTIVRQWKAFGFQPSGSMTLEPDQIRRLAYLAVGSGMRGLYFRSRSRLDHADERARAETLRLLNLELQVAEPWIAGGRVSTKAICNDSSVTAPVLRTDRAQLVVATHTVEGDQYVTTLGERTPMYFTVPGVSVGCSAYQVTDGGFNNLPAKRVAGGLQVPFSKDALPGLVVITRDPLVVNSLSILLQAQKQEMTHLRHRSAKFQVARARQVLASMAIHATTESDLMKSVNAVADNLERADRQTATGPHHPDSRRAVQEALTVVSQVRRRAWDHATRGFLQPTASPMCTQFATLPWHNQLAQALPTAQRHENLTPEGRFEDLVVMQHRGWTTLEHSPNDIITQVSLMAGEDGTKFLRIAAAGRTEQAKSSVVAEPLVWVNSPPIAVVPGQVFRISGRVRVPNGIRGSEDGFLVFDSLGGPQMAHRLKSSEDWSDFVIYRAATDDQYRLQLTLALAGLGEAWVDDLQVTPILKPGETARTASLDQTDKVLP